MNFTLHRDYSILPVVIGVVLIVSAIHTITVLTTSMLHTFKILDFLAMLSINEPAGGFSDLFFYNISSKLIWAIPMSALTYVFVRGGGSVRRTIILILAIAAIVAVSDQLSCLIKRLVERKRPSHTVGLSLLLHYVNGYHGGRYGFVSSHAANTMAVAVFLCLLLRRKLATVTLLVTTTLICFSRIYLGVHFPGDVLSGTCLGIVIGSIFYILICRFMGHGKAVVVEDKHSLVPLSLITTVAIIAVISACGVSL